MIAVITSPRAGASYLAQTLADVDASAEGQSRVVVSDSLDHRPDLPSGWTLVNFKRPATSMPENRWALWQCLSLADREDDELLVLEDDVRICRNGAWYMQHFGVPNDVDMVSFYAPYGGLEMPSGLWRARMHVFMYAQALKFPRRSVHALASRYLAMASDPRRGGSDEVLQLFGERLGWTYAIHYPGIVQHVGAVSAVGPGTLAGGRTSASFRGLDFDAKTLRQYLFD